MADVGRRKQPEKFVGESARLIMGIPIEEFHEDLTPIEYVKTYLNSREKRFIKHLMRTGEFVDAHDKSGFSVPCQNVLSRRHVKIALYRMASLATEPKIAAKMLHPLITERRLMIAMTGTNGESIKAMESLSAQGDTGRVSKVDHTHKITVPDRPWATPLLETKSPLSLPSKPEIEDDILIGG